MTDGDVKNRPPAGGDKRAQRKARQAEALRRNLARRKAQSRDRRDGGTGGDGGTDGGPREP